MNVTTEPKHSAIGIASFLISTIVGCLMLVLFIVAGILNGHRAEHGQPYPGQTLVGFAAIGLMAADVLALGLGIVAVFQPGKKRVFGILGLVFSGATVLGTIALIIIGLMFIAKARH